MIGYTIDELINKRASEYKERNNPLFHSCRHCIMYKQHCKILERKLKRKISWSCGDYTKCESWEAIDDKCSQDIN